MRYNARVAQAANSKTHIVDATILFVDMMNSVALSNSMTLLEYNDLINDYQNTLRLVISSIRQDYPVAEYYLGGDQLAVFFYDLTDAGLREKVMRLRMRNPNSPSALKIEQRLERAKSRSLYGALRCGVQVKNTWIANQRNIARVEAQQPVLDIGVGINLGNVILQQRGDGQMRIEGYAINFAKRVEGYSRYGSYCKIMLSKTAFETFRNTIVGHTMLKQRAFFEPYVPAAGMLKGLSVGTTVHELKFFHRLSGFAIQTDQVPHFTHIFMADPTNIWAYTNLINYHLYQQGDVAIASSLAHRALYANPNNEKIYYDLAEISFRQKEWDAAREYCHRALRLNDQLDIAYDMLADIEESSEGGISKSLDYRSKALALSPGCAEFHFDIALALAKLKRKQEAQQHLAKAREIFPSIEKHREKDMPELSKLLQLNNRGSAAE
jgi:class 3 adenylate cyclase